MNTKTTNGSAMHVASILQTISEGLVASDENGDITFVNDRAEKLLHTNKKALVGKNIRDVYPEAHNVQFYIQYNHARKTLKPVEFTQFYEPHQKTYRTRIYPSKSGIVCYFRDITKLQQTELELVESQKRYQSLFESMHMGVVYHNAHGEIITANPAALEILGLTMRQIQGRTPTHSDWRIIQEDGTSFPGDTHPASIALATGTVVKGVTMGVYHPKEKSYRWIKVDAVPLFHEGKKKPYQVYTLFEDISDLKKSRDELQLREDSFKVFAESVPHFVWAGGPNGKRDYVNAQYYEFTKAKKEELLGYEWIRFIHPDDIPTVQKKLQRITKDNKEVEIQYRVREGETGDYKWFLSKARPVKDIFGNVIRWIGTVTDIDEQKRFTEQQQYLTKVSTILGSSLNYQKTLQNVGQITVPHIADWCVIDIVNEGRTETVVVAHKDPKMVKWGYKLREKYPVDLNSPTGLAKVLRTKKPEFTSVITSQMLEQSTTDPEYLKIIKKIGFSSVIIVPIITRNKVVGTISFIATESRRHYRKSDLVVAQDVANRAAAAIENARIYEEAQRNEALYKALFDANIIGVVYSDFTGKIYDANDEFLRLISHTKSDLQKGLLNWEIVLPLEYKNKNINTGKELLKNGSIGVQEVELIKKDGSQVPVLVGGVLLDKKTTETLSFVLDITERKKVDQRKDEFIGIASHELKTPLTSIKGYTQILERIIQEMGDEKAKKYLSKTNNYIDRLNSLISDLLDVSKIQAGKLQFNISEFQFKDLIKDGIESMAHMNSRHTILQKGELDAVINGDKNRLEQVLNNFISNAIKYSPEADRVEISVTQKNGFITVAVKDYGVGIPKNKLPKLFERFYRVEETSKRFSGLGIGLYISSEIISRHGGNVWAESERGKGSTFYFSLPIHKSS